MLSHGMMIMMDERGALFFTPVEITINRPNSDEKYLKNYVDI